MPARNKKKTHAERNTDEKNDKMNERPLGRGENFLIENEQGNPQAESVDLNSSSSDER